MIAVRKMKKFVPHKEKITVVSVVRQVISLWDQPATEEAHNVEVARSSEPSGRL